MVWELDLDDQGVWQDGLFGRILWSTEGCFLVSSHSLSSLQVYPYCVSSPSVMPSFKIPGVAPTRELCWREGTQRGPQNSPDLPSTPQLPTCVHKQGNLQNKFPFPYSRLKEALPWGAMWFFKNKIKVSSIGYSALGSVNSRCLPANLPSSKSHPYFHRRWNTWINAKNLNIW